MVDPGRRKLKKYLFKGFISMLVAALSVDGVLSGRSDRPPSPTSDSSTGMAHGGQDTYDLETTSAPTMTHVATNSVSVQDSGMQNISPEKEVVDRNERNSMSSKYELTHHTNRQLNEYNNSEGEQLAYYFNHCPSNVECRKLGGDCIDCEFNESCTYGKNVTVFCSPKEGIVCTGSSNFTRALICRYCYQTMSYHQRCTSQNNCSVVSAPRATYRANCTVKHEVLCLGRRRFYKLRQCNWTSGYRWSTALALSISLGGFGVDRFYLGLWREGLGKLFSFGGLGVWTLVDVILIATGYVGPADGSVYIF